MYRIAPLLLLVLCMQAEDDSDYKNLKDDKGNSPFLGVTMGPPSSDTLERNRIDANRGVEIANEVFAGTTAEKMGLQKGDVIVSINGNSVDSMTDLRNEVSLIGVGGDAQVTVLRDGKPVTATGKLGIWPDSVPRDAIDDVAERRFRDWQDRKLDRIQQAVRDQQKRLEDAERLANGAPTEQLTDPRQALAKPVSQALRSLPAWKVTARMSHDTVTPIRTDNTETAWDARVLIGTPAPEIH